jgi:hypothetical protein
VSRQLLALVAALAAGLALAQYPGGGAPRGGTGSASHLPPSGASERRDPRASDVPVSVTGQVQVQLDRLGDDLRITAAQQPAWDAFATRAMRLADDVARSRFAVRSALDAPPSPAPQQFDRIADTARTRAVAIEGVAEAGRALYGTLTSEQKSIADRRLALVLLPLAAGASQVAPTRDEDAPSRGQRPPR